MTSPLEAIIRQEIMDQGPMRLDRYMALCLGHPDYGYYMTRDPFGTAGDFTTAPEISQIFGEMIGLWIAECWMAMGRPDPFILLECGPGRGTMMQDIMRITRAVPKLHEAVQIVLLESSPLLRVQQAEKLKDYRPQWIEDIGAFKVNAPVIVIGNEFLDALPVRQFVYDGSQWLEKCVALNKNNSFRIVTIKSDFHSILMNEAGSKPPQTGDVQEVSPEQECFVRDLIKSVTNQIFAGLFIDYGSAQNRPVDTLQAVMNHCVVDILEAPGCSDLTTHVRFSAVADWLREAGMTVHGPVLQRDFLIRMGAGLRLAQLIQGATAQQAYALQSGYKRLTADGDPRDTMGRLFKVIGFCSDPNLSLMGVS